MKLNTLNKILNVLKNEENEVVLNKEDILDALLPLDRMLERKN